jgi:hypothetical protein
MFSFRSEITLAQLESEHFIDPKFLNLWIDWSIFFGLHTPHQPMED